jgi:hypothetical protein
MLTALRVAVRFKLTLVTLCVPVVILIVLAVLG